MKGVSEATYEAKNDYHNQLAQKLKDFSKTYRSILKRFYNGKNTIPFN